MANFISSYTSRVVDYAYYMTFGYVLDATPCNLAWALKQSKEEVLKYQFKEDRRIYSPLEYAVKSGDIPSVSALIDFGAKLDYSRMGGGDIIHFYMDCLREDASPNLELLNFLLDRMPDINSLDDNFFTYLERALDCMGYYKAIHWDVVETLLKRGISVTEGVYGVPLSRLNIAHDSKAVNTMTGAVMCRSDEEENVFLDNLVKYLTLERKYNPASTSALTLIRFKFHTGSFQNFFRNTASSFSVSSFYCKGLEGLSTALREADIELGEKKNLTDQELLDLQQAGQFRTVTQTARRGIRENQANRVLEINRVFFVYHDYFKELVREGAFKDCFDPSDIALIVSALREINNEHSKALLLAFQHWGLMEKEVNC